MKKKILIMSCLLLVTLCAFSLSYDPDSWTKCITNGVGVNGEQVENNYFCNSFDGHYNGEEATLSKCELNGMGEPGCSGNSLGFYPSMY